jgi:hypothetical protein
MNDQYIINLDDCDTVKSLDYKLDEVLVALWKREIDPFEARLPIFQIFDLIRDIKNKKKIQKDDHKINDKPVKILHYLK